VSLNIEGVPVTDAEPATVPTVASIVAVPSLMPVATPADEMFITPLDGKRQANRILVSTAGYVVK